MNSFSRIELEECAGIDRVGERTRVEGSDYLTDGPQLVCFVVSAVRATESVHVAVAVQFIFEPAVAV